MSVTVTINPALADDVKRLLGLCKTCGHKEEDHEQESDNAYCIGNLALRSKLPANEYMPCGCKLYVDPT